MPMRVRTRRILIAAAALAAAGSLTAMTPAAAGPGTSPARTARTVAAPATAARTVSASVAPAAAAQGDPRSVTQRVADFYGAYIDTAWDGSDPAAGADAKALKAFYLTAGARRAVAAYEAREHADGILFAQNVPVKWKVAYAGSGGGHATSRVYLTWSDGRNAQVTKIDVRSDLRTRKITDLRPVR
ncbi:hypothetical protein ACFPC0_37440 [Streptomyces andamanensis]|uniref:Nuclear transport factor 2 family protein n=1 Tax=Streptomyces andamanensis TaxID=1565035 RepID=A0ABV8TS57_9ACTN|nr:hypothetical protein [Streptomyces sp. PsTaAH-124]